jgi:hypothetical protein
MPQKKKAIKKDVKKAVSKPKPPLKNSVNVKIGLDDLRKLTCASCAAEEKKKKPKRRKAKAQTTTDNNVSYVDESGQPMSNEIINKSFNRSYMPQPFSRNSTVIGTSFNESAIMDKVIEKMSKLNNTSNMSLNQSTNNTSLNQSGIAPPQLPRQAPARTQALSTIAPASPSVAPQSLNFDSPPRPVGLTPMQASSMAMNTVQQYAMASMRAAVNSQEALKKIFKGVTDMEQAEIKQKVQIVKDNYKELISIGKTGGAQFMKFVPYFKTIYDGSMVAKEAASIAWQYYQFID